MPWLLGSSNFARSEVRMGLTLRFSCKAIKKRRREKREVWLNQHFLELDGFPEFITENIHEIFVIFGPIVCAV